MASGLKVLGCDARFSRPHLWGFWKPASSCSMRDESGRFPGTKVCMTVLAHPGCPRNGS